MANSNENSLNAHLLNPDFNPTSEVGSGPYVTMEQLMGIMRQMTQSREQRPIETFTTVPLPRFNPGSLGSDPAAWCATVDVIMEEKPLQGSALLCALSAALESSAAQWLTQVPATQVSSWPKFKDRFLIRYGGKETVATALWKMKNGARLEGETLGDYSSRLRFFLMAR